MKYAIFCSLLLILYSLFFVSPASAQTSAVSCPYKTNVIIYKEVKGGQIASVSDVGTLSIANDKGSPPTSLNTNNLAQYSYLDGINFSTSPYKQGSEATVTLTGLDRNKWDIVGEFCDPHSSVQGCPGPKSAVYYKNEPDGIIKGFRVNCGVDITYGWVIKPHITSPPAATGTTYQMSIRDTNKSGDACFLSVDSKTGYIKGNSTHCRVASCTPPNSSQITGLVVDYANTTTAPITSLQWQTNVCGQVHGELPGGDKNNCIENSFTDSVSSIEPRTLDPGKTIRCTWQSPSATNQKPVCRVLTSSDNTNPAAGCSSSALPPAGGSATPRVGGPTKTVIPPTGIPLPTPGFIYTVMPADVQIHWDFTNKITDLVDPKDSQILGLKIGICNDSDSANYRKKTKRIGGGGPLCKWYDTYRTDKPLTRKDTPKGSTQLAKPIDLDFNNNLLDSSKSYYLTCQYFILRNGLFGSDYTAYDKWRRCKPNKVEPHKKIVFSNILSPAQYVDDIPQEVPLSDGSSLMIPPKSGSTVIPVKFLFDSEELVDNPVIIEDVHFFRLGICKDLPIAELQSGNKNCTFFDTTSRLTEKQGETHDVFYTTGPDNKPLESGKAYYITCQYKILDLPTIIDRTTRRCNPRRVVANQLYSSSPTWQYFNAYDDSFRLQNDGEAIIPLSLKLSAQKYKSAKE